jgi:hypothetical protein
MPGNVGNGGLGQLLRKWAQPRLKINKLRSNAMQAPIFMPRGAPNGAWSLPETACGNVLFAGGARFREEDFRAVRIADRRIQIKQVPARRGRVAVLPSRAAQGIPAPPGRHDLTYIARAARLRRN